MCYPCLQFALASYFYDENVHKEFAAVTAIVAINSTVTMVEQVGQLPWEENL